MADWSEDDERLIRAQLDRMAACPIFAQGGRMVALLRYLVDAALAGTADALNQYRIAIDVMAREDRKSVV